MHGILLWTVALLLLGLCLLITGIVLKKKQKPSSVWFRIAAVIVLLIACFLVILAAVSLS